MTVLQEVIQWTIENARNIEDQAGNHWIAIDHEEMRTKFEEWLEMEKSQMNRIAEGTGSLNCPNCGQLIKFIIK